MTESKAYVILSCSVSETEMRSTGLLTLSEESFSDPFQMYYQHAPFNEASRSVMRFLT